ncbi:ionotropic receptor 75a-like isoform X2 [Trichoplusia ni]|uniref:Ionotropic receptor 75a-like isoform X2 n=1 Tax=Trichoplusia ni TaxID=7111 RepID=A0A7E5WIL5_TRINI|nr:ionotropic receptor 75a-like isoform X2 [Trichoplusia ni]
MNLVSNILLTFTIADVSIIIDLFKHKNIKNGIIFHCHDQHLMNNVHRILNDNDIFMTSAKTGFDTYKVTKSYPKVGVILNTACEGWTAVLDSGKFPFQDYFFLIFTEHLSHTTDILSDYPVEVDSDLIIAHNALQLVNFYEVYNTGFKFNGTFNVKHIGHWNSSLFLKASDRRNLQGVFVKTAVIILSSPKIVNQTIEQYMEKPIKSQIKVDTVHRMKYFIMMKFMRDMFNIRHSFIFRHPKYPRGFYTIYTRPLSDVVWYCVIALLVVTALVLWGMLVVQNNTGDNEDSSLSFAGLVIWGAICQQAVTMNREATSTKLVIFLTFVYAVTLYQYYNATIVSSLLLEPPRDIRTLKDLLHSDLKAGSHDIVYDRDYFKRTTDPIAIKLYQKKMATSPRNNFFAPEEGIAMVKKGGFAFHIDTTVAFPIIKATFKEREICDTNLVQMYPLQRMGVVIRKNSPYKEHIAYGIRKIYEVGLPPRIQSEIDVPMPACAHTPDTSVFCVGIREFSTPILALIIGMVTSVMILIVEIAVSRVFSNRGFVMFRH